MQPLILLLFILVIFVSASGYMVYRHNAEKRGRKYATNFMIEFKIEVSEGTNR